MSLPDKFYFLSGFTAIIIGVIAISLFWAPTYDVLRDLGSVSVNKSLDNVTPSATSDWLDWIIIFAYFAFNVLICVVLPLSVENNPIYYIVLFVVSFLYAYIVAILANVLYDTIVSLTSDFNHTLFLINHLVEIEIMFLMLMAVIMFFKRRQSGESYYQ